MLQSRGIAKPRKCDVVGYVITAVLGGMFKSSGSQHDDRLRTSICARCERRRQVLERPYQQTCTYPRAQEKQHGQSDGYHRPAKTWPSSVQNPPYASQQKQAKWRKYQRAHDARSDQTCTHEYRIPLSAATEILQHGRGEPAGEFSDSYLRIIDPERAVDDTSLSTR